MKTSVWAVATTSLMLAAGCGDGSSESFTDSGSGISQVTPAAPTRTVVRTTPPAPPPPATEAEAAPPRTRVPKLMVGTWDGDRAQLSFSPAGDVSIRFKQNSLSDSGTVVIDGRSMTLYLSGGTQTIQRWEISKFDAGYGYEFYNLILDGSSYVRDVPK